MAQDTAADDTHESFWDCIEQSSTKQAAHRLTPDALCDKIRVFTCRECGRTHVEEVWFFEGTREVSETNRYGLRQPKDVTTEDILADYGL